MLKHIGLLFLITFFLAGCAKHKEKTIQNEWIFKSTPQTNINTFQGYQEDRTVFNGTETIEFEDNGAFIVNDTLRGTWVYNSGENRIEINQTLGQEYSCTGYSQTTMWWEIIDLSNDEMTVNHPYYKWTDNKYFLKKK
jgi:outer membrane biogenesis lipoprotein LolB